MKLERVKFKAFKLSSGNGCRRIKPHTPVGVVGCGAEVVSGPAVVSSGPVVSGRAVVSGPVVVSNGAVVSGAVVVSSRAVVSGPVVVSNGAVVPGNAVDPCKTRRRQTVEYNSITDTGFIREFKI